MGEKFIVTVYKYDKSTGTVTVNKVEKTYSTGNASTDFNSAVTEVTTQLATIGQSLTTLDNFVVTIKRI